MVGDFDSNILPLFFHYVEDVRIHVLLYDKRHTNLEHTKQITKGIKKFCDHYSYYPTLLEMSFNEDSVESIEEVYKKISAKVVENELLYFNTTDGLASTTAVLQPLLKKDKGYILAYDRFENTCNIFKDGEMIQEYISPMNIDEHLMLKNIDYEIVAEDEAMRKRKASVFKLLKHTGRYMEYKKIINTISSEHELYWMKEELRKIASGIDKNYALGPIFEEYCYWLVKDLGFDDVQLGVKITHNPQGSNDFKNELDVLVMKDNHLHVIECKLRTFIDGECFIYKYDSIGQLLDSDGRRMIVAIGGDNLKTSKSGKKFFQFNNSNIKRAEHMNILIYQEKVMRVEHFKNEVKRFFLAKSL